MITTDRNRKGRCYDCGQTAIIAAREGADLLCVDCYDSAGDDNSVSDGHMTCTEFMARWGKHSTYCPGHAPVDPAYTVVLTKSQMERVLLAIWMPGHDLDEQDVAILTAMNTGTLVPSVA